MFPRIWIKLGKILPTSLPELPITAQGPQKQPEIFKNQLLETMTNTKQIVYFPLYPLLFLPA